MEIVDVAIQKEDGTIRKESYHCKLSDRSIGSFPNKSKKAEFNSLVILPVQMNGLDDEFQRCRKRST